MKKLILFFLACTVSSIALARPNWKIPLEGGIESKVTNGYDGGNDTYHTDLSNGYHAIDFGKPLNILDPKIVAAADGTIVKIYNDPSRGYGYGVKIDHGGGYTSVYGHFKELPIVKVGDKVTQGQQLGIMGSTGWSTGPHLHFAISFNGQCKSNVPESKPEPISGYTNITANQTYLSDNYFNPLSFTFNNRSSQGFACGNDTVEAPGNDVDAWQVKVNGTNPGIVSPKYLTQFGLKAETTIIKFSLRVLGNTAPTTGEILVKDENDSWDNFISFGPIDTSHNYREYTIALSGLRPDLIIKQFRIEATNGGNGEEYWSLDWLNIYSCASEWDFTTNQLGWSLRNASLTCFYRNVDLGYVYLEMNPNESDPGLVSQNLINLNASNYRYLNIRFAANKVISDSLNQSGVYFETSSSGTFSPDNSVKFARNVVGDGVMRWYTADLAVNSRWSGDIKRLRIDPLPKVFADNSDAIRIDKIELSNIPRDTDTVIEYPVDGYKLVFSAEETETMGYPSDEDPNPDLDLNPNTIPTLYPPENLSVCSVSDTAIQVCWDKGRNADGIDLDYDIYMNGEFIGGAAGPTYVAMNLAQNTDYCFSVIAKYSGYESSMSNTLCARVLTDITDPAIDDQFSSFTSWICMSWEYGSYPDVWALLPVNEKYEFNIGEEAYFLTVVRDVVQERYGFRTVVRKDGIEYWNNSSGMCYAGSYLAFTHDKPKLMLTEAGNYEVEKYFQTYVLANGIKKVVSEQLLSVQEFRVTLNDPAPVLFDLTANVVGIGTIEPSGLSHYAQGETVALTAVPGDKQKLVRWVGTVNDSSIELNNSVLMDTDHSVQVEFTSIYDYDNNMVINKSDTTVILQAVRKLIPIKPEYDLNQDGKVTFIDASLHQKLY